MQGVDEACERQKFSSRILPAYARRSPKVSDVLPILYLRGLSTGDFAPALRDLLGEDASGLSASSIVRLTEQWQTDHAAFRQRSLRFHRYAYLFVDGVHMSIRLGEDDRLCLLVVIGIREDVEKELLAVEDGDRRMSREPWSESDRTCPTKLQGARRPLAPTAGHRWIDKSALFRRGRFSGSRLSRHASGRSSRTPSATARRSSTICA